MTWVRLDDGFHSHPKVLAVGLAGAGLFARSLAYCGNYLTNGFVPEAWVAGAVRGAVRGAERMLPDQLVAAGLWERVEGGWQIHDFLDYNPTADAVRRDRETAKQRADRARARKKLREAGCRCSDPLDPDEGAACPPH